ncbi:NAD-dependent epimerase/dehydratase family protein [Haladaptatus sp. R4]|uniref:NAD-dependent epimerase/dehydratase family protein n=1 Tax=Haladaptatus sp. R4 TaxID=1679489 RepID=UPI0037433C96
MRVTVIGATGHIGSYLVPRLVRAGHEVVAVSRGKRDPYQDDSVWTASRWSSLTAKPPRNAASSAKRLRPPTRTSLST